MISPAWGCVQPVAPTSANDRTVAGCSAVAIILRFQRKDERALSERIPVDDLHVVDSFEVIDVRGENGELLGTSGRADIDVMQIV